MAYTTINKSSLHFTPKIFTGTGSSQSITGLGFQPDWCWFKNRGVNESNNLYDVVRGATYRIYSDSNAAQSNSGSSSRFVSFDSDGFTVGGDGMTNGSGASMVAWNWKAGNSQGSSNTDGSVNTTYTSVNTTAGFSISTYTGTGNAGATIGHGLGAVPNCILIKKLAGGSARDWAVYHSANTSAPETEILYLNNTDATADSSAYWNDTAPTSSIITLGAANEVNESPGHTYVAYCFAEKAGYSKFGSYTGTGDADGAFVYTGFKPAFLMIKRTNDVANWNMYDSKRLGYNVNNYNLAANTTGTDDAGNLIDILSNGFKPRNTDVSNNGSGDSYIYMAFGQSLVGSNNVPCTAR